MKDAIHQFIDAYVHPMLDDLSNHVTFVYREPSLENRHRMWSQLALLKASSSLPWVLVGDFNETL
jgi:hypothetical protein